MARKSTQSMSENALKDSTGSSRDAQIASGVTAGWTNEAILAAFESMDDGSILEPKHPRRVKGMVTFDKVKRQRLQEAIRSVRFKMQTDEEDISRELTLVDDGDLKPIDQVAFRNIHRFSSGIPALDRIYGSTNFVHLDGKDMGKPTGHVEIGLPHAFLSIWGGSPGVGKTRLAIAVTKSLNKLGRKVLYYNGEATESDFRVWVGMDVNPKLFMVRSTDALRLEMIVADAYRTKAEVIIVDSLQMIKAAGGIMAILTRLKMLKSDPAAGMPHIILISQLNKKGELKGKTDLEHMVDFSATVTKLEGREGQFRLECPRKNRGGPTPRYGTFKHYEGTVVAVSTDAATAQELMLKQAGPIVTGPPIEDEPEAIVKPFVPAVD